MELWKVGELRMGMHLEFWAARGGTDIFVGVPPPAVFLGRLNPAVRIRREIVVDGTHCRSLTMQCVSFGTYDRLETKEEK